MKLPIWLVGLGYGGLLPFLAGPLVLTLWPSSAPVWLDEIWFSYVALVAVFMAGTLWGFGVVILSEGGSGRGVLIASSLMLLVWVSTWLDPYPSLYALLVVYALSLLADHWREREMGSFPGYFKLRSLLTVGALGAIVWRIALF